MPTDPLSDVISFLKPHTYVAGGFNLGGDWSLQFEMHEGIKYFALVSGCCWLAVEGEPLPILLEADDCVLLPNGRRFRMARELSFKATHISELSESDWIGGLATVNDGGHTLILGGHFDFSGDHTKMLLGAMPPIMRLRDKDESAGLRWSLNRMREELTGGQPGSVAVVQNLAHVLLVQALRLYLAHGSKRTGWLFALGDPKLAPAVNAIHAEPGSPWTLPILAKKAGMSRSKFALRFKSITGLSPIDYVLRWRMLLASERLKRGNESISAIATSLGYQSDSAFNTAFKRVIGCSPGKFS
jgi:AraC-like DNA-binding protein